MSAKASPNTENKAGSHGMIYEGIVGGNSDNNGSHSNGIIMGGIVGGNYDNNHHPHAYKTDMYHAGPCRACRPVLLLHDGAADLIRRFQREGMPCIRLLARVRRSSSSWQFRWRRQRSQTTHPGPRHRAEQRKRLTFAENLLGPGRVYSRRRCSPQAERRERLSSSFSLLGPGEGLPVQKRVRSGRNPPLVEVQRQEEATSP